MLYDPEQAMDNDMNEYGEAEAKNQFDAMQIIRSIKNVFVKRKMEKKRKKILRKRRKQIKRQQGIPVSSDSSTDSSDIDDDGGVGGVGANLPLYPKIPLTYTSPNSLNTTSDIGQYLPQINTSAYVSNPNHYCFQCSNPLTDVRKLTCGHAFCSNCLDTHIYGGNIQCPVCQTVTNLKGVVAATLPTDGNYNSYSVPASRSQSAPTSNNNVYVGDTNQSNSSVTNDSTPFNYYTNPAPLVVNEVENRVTYRSPRIKYLKPSVYKSSNFAESFDIPKKTQYETKKYKKINDFQNPKKIYVNTKLDIGENVLSRIQEVVCPPNFARSTSVGRLIEMLLVHDLALSPASCTIQTRSINGTKTELPRKMKLIDCGLTDGDTLYLRAHKRHKQTKQYNHATKKSNNSEDSRYNSLSPNSKILTRTNSSDNDHLNDSNPSIPVSTGNILF